MASSVMTVAGLLPIPSGFIQACMVRVCFKRNDRYNIYLLNPSWICLNKKICKLVVFLRHVARTPVPMNGTNRKTKTKQNCRQDLRRYGWEYGAFRLSGHLSNSLVIICRAHFLHFHHTNSGRSSSSTSRVSYVSEAELQWGSSEALYLTGQWKRSF